MGGLVAGDTVTLHVHDHEIFDNTHLFKNHRAYLQYRFGLLGYTVHTWKGIRFHRDPSDEALSLEVRAKIGTHLRRLK